MPRRDEAVREASGAGALPRLPHWLWRRAPADATIGVMIGGNDQVNRQRYADFDAMSRWPTNLAGDFDTAQVSARGLAEMMRRLPPNAPCRKTANHNII